MPRVMLRGRVEEDTAHCWDRFLTTEGLTFSAVLEALGQEMAVGRPPSRRVVKLARKIDRERSSRR
jgi:hypothetical protein